MVLFAVLRTFYLCIPQVINEVGAVSLRATLNCDAFATEHSSTSHFDKSSFVGLAVICADSQTATDVH